MSFSAGAVLCVQANGSSKLEFHCHCEEKGEPPGGSSQEDVVKTAISAEGCTDIAFNTIEANREYLNNFQKNKSFRAVTAENPIKDKESYQSMGPRQNYSPDGRRPQYSHSTTILLI